MDVHYKDTVFKNRSRADLLVDEKVLIENKAIKKLTNQDEAQLINYLFQRNPYGKNNRYKGLLFNFGSVPMSRDDMLRRIR